MGARMLGADAVVAILRTPKESPSCTIDSCLFRDALGNSNGMVLPSDASPGRHLTVGQDCSHLYFPEH